MALGKWADRTAQDTKDQRRCGDGDKSSPTRTGAYGDVPANQMRAAAIDADYTAAKPKIYAAIKSQQESVDTPSHPESTSDYFTCDELFSEVKGLFKRSDANKVEFRFRVKNDAKIRWASDGGLTLK